MLGQNSRKSEKLWDVLLQVLLVSLLCCHYPLSLDVFFRWYLICKPVFPPQTRWFPNRSLVEMSTPLEEPVTGLAHFLALGYHQLRSPIPALQRKWRQQNSLHLSMVPSLCQCSRVWLTLTFFWRSSKLPGCECFSRALCQCSPRHQWAAAGVPDSFPVLQEEQVLDLTISSPTVPNKHT